LACRNLTLILCLWCCSLPLLALAGQGFDVGDLAVLIDPQGQETIASVSAASAQGRFTPLKHNLSAGYTRKVHWLRFTVRAPAAGEWWLEVQPMMLDDLRLYVPRAHGFREHQGGDLLPFSAREVEYRSAVFRLTLPDTMPSTCYLRVETSSTSLVLLKLWQPRTFQKSANAEYALFGFYYGFVVLVLMLCLGIWVWLRDPLFGWFSLHIFSALPLYLGLNGFVAEYLFPDAPHLANLWIGAWAFFSLSAAAPFVRRILRVESHHTLMLLVVRVMLWLPPVLALSLFSHHYTEAIRIAISVMLLVVVASLGRAHALWRAGYEESLYILIGVAFTLLGGVLTGISLLGFNPGDFFLADIRQITGVGNMFAMFIALMVRITAIREAGHEAEKRAISAKEAHAEQSRFIAMLSHELKTPLAVIDGAAQSLQRLNPMNAPEVSRRHVRIRNAVARINRLVEQFLTTDRIDSNGQSTGLEWLDIVPMLQQCAEHCVDGAARVRLNLPTTLRGQFDTPLLRVALTNLLDNALKYSPEQTHVTVTARKCIDDESRRSGIEIVVTDAGGGIPPDLVPRLFDRYARGENVGAISGAGLGLHLVQRIAALHGGSITLLPSQQGAAFRLWLPQGEFA
jgi:signal transduction histidine kinase